MSTRSAESRENSPDQDDSLEKRVSKKRKVLSCYACRNRKMKCDRIYPVCGRCQKTGRADQCTYDPRLIEDLHVNGDGHANGGPAPPHMHDINHNHAFAALPAPPADSLSWQLRAQERRLAVLERRLANTDSSTAASPAAPERYHEDHFDPQAAEPTLQEEMMFRGKGFKTQFYGSTSAISLLTQFRELQAFTKEALAADSSMARVRNDFRTFRNRRKAFIKDKRAETQGFDDEIFALVPEKKKIDAAVDCYFTSCESTYRVLHEPTFRKEYRAFWDERSRAALPPSFAAILVLIAAIAGGLLDEEETMFIGDISTHREAATTSIETCDFWLQRQSRKHLTLHFFQLQCLSLFAKRVNCIKMKQDWVASGDVMRLAIGAGLHRDPSLLGKISEFEKEMRRRLWATIAELELQSSIDAGHQSSLCGLHYDTQPPANVPDDAFDPDIEQRPIGRPLEHFTRTSYLSCTVRSLPLRVHLLHVLNNPAANIQYADVLHFGNRIASILATHPDWHDAQAAIPAAMLDLQLRQFLLMLHRPYAKLAPKSSRFSYSFTAVVDTASRMLSLCEELLDKSLFILSHSRNDVLRIVITLAQVVFYNATMPETTDSSAIARSPAATSDHVARSVDNGGPQNPLKYAIPPGPPLQIPHLPKHNHMAATLCTTSIDLMEFGRTLFEQKVMHLGTGYMEYWLMSAAIGIMPSTPTTPATTSKAVNTAPDDLRSRGRKAVERMTSMCFRVLALQKDPTNGFAQALRGAVTSGSPSDYHSAIQSGASSVAVPNHDTPLTVASNNFPMQPFIPGASGMAASLDEGTNPAMGLSGPWDVLQDMQVDLGGWNFPDFWGFDVGGDF
ncbi:hypothetical protein K491DRAFT_610463 [Lophiostoma macrostomum CBS 122681]|uniref:Zn(2)-C6 fungal-type domain-containing protein n=1 Tax=Lophiostoma macrostomum CBS 122681 TaxID=1314788 RepID=A0A6A6SSP3_9PLEO|nr:hypothetical protein K491DRAFT_610463 [Lophiostoma macrostomum CBS 122681]